MKKKRVFYFGISFFWLVSLGMIPTQGVAKDKTPPVYEQGKLLDIQETEKTSTSYRTVKQKDGSSITEPITDTQKIYHISVQVGDLIYVGRYAPAFSFSKVPGWIIGDPIQVRFNKNKMILQRPGGKELKTSIEKRYRAENNEVSGNNSGN